MKVRAGICKCVAIAGLDERTEVSGKVLLCLTYRFFTCTAQRNRDPAGCIDQLPGCVSTIGSYNGNAFLAYLLYVDGTHCNFISHHFKNWSDIVHFVYPLKNVISR